MISRSRSSLERSPPLASGWWRFTSSLKRTLIFAVVASPSSPRVSSALRSALRMTRVSRRRRCSPFFASPNNSNGSSVPSNAGPNRAARERPVGLPPFMPIFQVGRWPITASR